MSTISTMMSSSFERTIRCPKCSWEGRNTIERIEQQNSFQDFGFLIATGLQSIKCPKCGAETIPLTKKMVS